MAIVSEVIINDGASATLGKIEGALDRVTAAELKTTRATDVAGRQFEQLRRIADPIYGTYAKLTEQHTKLQRAVDLGATSQANANAVYTQLHRQAELTVQKLNAVGEAVDRNARAWAAYNQKATSQSQINTWAGVRTDFGTAGRGEDVAAYGQALDQVRAKYNPLFAAQQAYRSELTDISQALRVGAISQAEYAQAIDRTKTAFSGQVQVITGAAAAAKEKAAADKLAATEQERLGLSAQKYKDQLNPLLPLQRAYKAELVSINEVAKAGLLTDTQRVASIQKTKEAFVEQVSVLKNGTPALNDNRKAMDAASVAARQMQFGLTNLSFQVNDVVSGLASGQEPFRIFAQQSGQIFQIFQTNKGLLGEIGTTIRGWITPMNLAVAGIAALAVGVGVLVARAADANQSMRVFDVTLRGMGATALADAAGLEAAAKQLRDVGLSAAEARQKINEVTRAGLNPASAPQIIRTGADLSAYLGGDQTQALTQALAGGIETAVKYGIAVRALTVPQAQLALEMARGGQAGRELDQVFQRIIEHAKGLERDALSPGARAARDMNVAWKNALDALADTTPILRATEALAGLAGLVERLSKYGIFHSPGTAALTGAGIGVGGGLVTGAIAGGVMGGPWGAALGGVLGAVGGAGIGAGYGYGVGALNQPGTANNPFQAGLPPAGAAGLNPELQIALRDMIADAASQGIVLGIGSGLRSTQRQAELYAADIAKSGGRPSGMVAPPGRSQHEVGGAADLVNAQGQLVRAGSPEAAWLAANASRYVTRPMSYEPWHVEPPGGRTTGAGVAGGAGGGSAASDQAILAAREYAAAQNLLAKATQGVGLEQDKARIAAEVLGRADLDWSGKVELATGLLAAAKTRLTNEITNQTTATKLEVDGARQIADAYAIGTREGKIQEAIFRSETEALRLFGKTSGEAAEQYVAARTVQIREQERFNESLRNAQDLLAGKDTQAQLQAQIGLTGQLPEIAQRELTLLQAKQTITRDFPFLTEQEKNNRLAMVTATADLNVKLAETQRAQQQIDSIFSSIGNTIQSSIGNVIEGIFDPSKAVKWGDALTGIFKSIGNTLLQGLLIKPLTGSLLGALGASPSVVNQFGSFGGSSGGGLSLGNLFSGAGLVKDVAGLGGSSFSGGLFGGVNSFLNSSIGPSLGFATPGTGSLSSLIGIESSTLSSIPGISGAGLTGTSATAGSLFGLTTLSSALPFIGIAGGILGMILPMLFGNKKPRNQSAGANFDLSNFELTAGFSGGNSQIDQQTQQVAQGVQQFLALLKTTGGQLTGNVLLQNGVNTGFTVDSSLPQYSGRFNLGKDPTSTMRTIELALARSLTGISDTMKTVIDQIGDPAEIEAAIAFAVTYDDLKTAADEAFKSVEAGKNELGPFATAMQQINVTFQALTDQANRFGLALDPLVAGLAEATTRLQGDFTTALKTAFNEATGAGFINQLQGVYDETIKAMQESIAVGLGSDKSTQDLISQIYGAQLNTILSGLDQTQLDQVVAHFTGLNDTIVSLALSTDIATAANDNLAAAQEQQAAQAAQIAQATTQITDYVTSLRTTPSLSGISPENAIINARSEYETTRDLAQTGDMTALEELTGAADTFVQNIRSFYGSSLYGQSLIGVLEEELSGIASTFSPVANDPVVSGISATTAATEAASASNDNWLSSIFNVTAAMGDTAKAQRDVTNGLLTEVRDLLRLWAAAA